VGLDPNELQPRDLLAEIELNEPMAVEALYTKREPQRPTKDVSNVGWALA